MAEYQQFILAGYSVWEVNNTQSALRGKRAIRAARHLLHCPPPFKISAGPGMNPSEIEKLIEAGLPDAEARVLSDDNTHYVAIVIAESFDGQRPLARHQLVYRCLGDLMGKDIHAMSIRAYTPAEWQEFDPSRQS